MPLKRIHPYANSLKMNSFILVLLSCATLILFYLASELVYSSNYIITRSINCLRSIIIILNIISAIMIYRYYYLILQIRKAYKEVSKASTIFNDKITRRHFLCELIIIIPSIPPMLSWNTEFSQIGTTVIFSLDDLIMALAIFRVYFILKFAHEMSPFNSSRGKFYMNLFNVEFPLKFLIKSYISMKPFLSIGLVAILGILISGISLRVFEKTVPGIHYHSIWDQFYLISITQTTVGYGDTVAQTHIGRTICVVSGLFGLFLYSYMVLSVNRFTELNRKEKEFYEIATYNYSIKKMLTPSSIILIQRWWRLLLKRKKNTKRFDEFSGFFFQIKHFHNISTKLLQGRNDTFQDCLNHLDKVSCNKLKNSLKYFEPFTKYEKLGHDYVKDEYDILRKMQNIKSLIVNNEIFSKSYNTSRKSSIATRSSILKPHIKVLIERARKRMISTINSPVKILS